MAYESESLQVGGDPNDSKSSANLISPGDWMRGNLASADDVDFFKVTLAGPGLLSFTFDGQDPKRSTNSWKIDVLDSNLDYVRTLATSATGSSLTATATADSKTISVSGLSTAAKAGDRFTAVTSAADTQIYTVVAATALKGGGQTLVLDSAWSSTSDTQIAFDPGQISANGGLGSLNTYIAQAGTYYLKVSAAAFTDSNYALKVGFSSALETDLNNTKEQAVSENSRLVPDLSHQGQVSTSDSDVWLISTAAGGTFKLDFAAASGDANTAFNLKVETWTKVNGRDVLSGVNSRGQAVSGAVTGSKSIEIDSTAYPNATTFVVTVTATSITGSAKGAYTLKASGAGLDINDAPLIQVGSYTSGKPDELLDLSQSVKASVGAGKEIALSSLMSASDADGQALSYKFALSPASGSSATGSISIKQAQGDPKPYVNGSSMTAADFANAYVVAGNSTGSLVLDAQAFDSSGMPDNSGTSSLVRLNVRVVSNSAGVTITDDGSLALKEGAANGASNYEETLSFKLDEAPQSGETVTLRLLDTDKQLILDKTALTFTSSNYSVAQTVKVRALGDGKDEGAHTARLSFSLTSDSDASSYSGLQIKPLTFALTDPSNTVATGTVTLSGEATQGQTVTADTSTVADADGLGSFNYLWQRSQDNGATWSDIDDATSQSYTLAVADAGSKVRVVLSFIDGKGSLETLNSGATETVVAVNVRPVTEDAEVSVVSRSGSQYIFKASDFPFADANPADGMSSVVLLDLPGNNTLVYNGQKVSVTELLINKGDIEKLRLEVPADKSVGDAVSSFSFQVMDSSGGVSDTHVMTARVGSVPGVNVVDGNVNLNLVEGASAASSSYERELGFSLKEAPPGQDVVTLTLIDSDTQLVFDKSALTFTSDNYRVVQTVKVRALDDGKAEGAHSGKLNFALTSSNSGSSYVGLQLSALSFSLSDPVNSLVTGAVTLSGESKSGKTLTADTSTVADADGLGTLAYLWQRSSDGGASWTDIADATAKSYTLAAADTGSKVRVTVSFVDGRGNREALSSSPSSTVEAAGPVSSDSEVLALPTPAFEYQFKLSDFPFEPGDSGETLGSITVLTLPSDAVLRYMGQEITSLDASGLRLDRASVSKLSILVPAGKSTGDTIASFGFKVSDSSGISSAQQSMSVVLGDPARTVYVSPGNGYELGDFSAYGSTTGLSTRMLSSAGLNMALDLSDGGSSALVTLVVDSSLDANGYWVKDEAGYWVNLAQDVQTSGGLTTLQVQLQDGQYDSDAAEGVIEQDAVIANMPLSVVGVTPDPAENGPWF